MKKLSFLEQSVRGLAPNSPLESINDRLEFIRCVLGFPLNAFAGKIGSSRAAVKNVLGKKGDDPSLKGVATIFSVSEEWLYIGKGKPFLVNNIKGMLFTSADPTSEVDDEVNARIKQLRAELDLSQALFANTVGITRDALAFIETNKSNASLYLIKSIVLKYGISPQWLLFWRWPEILEAKVIA